MAFLIEKTLAKIEEELEKNNFLFEADEQETEQEGETTEDASNDNDEAAIDEPVNEEDGNGEDEVDDPNDIPLVERGEYISDLEKGEIAKDMLAALMATPPPQGEIPYEKEKITKDNADDVIKFVRNAITLNTLTDSDEIIQELQDSPI